MPYIKQADRQILDPDIKRLVEHITCSGELNYTLTRIVAGVARCGLCYEKLNAAIGALECAKQELYRRLAVPYEDGKVASNGDVPEYKPS
jgi:hypothetical protein